MGKCTSRHLFSYGRLLFVVKAKESIAASHSQWWYSRNLHEKKLQMSGKISCKFSINSSNNTFDPQATSCYNMDYL